MKLCLKVLLEGTYLTQWVAYLRPHACPPCALPLGE